MPADDSTEPRDRRRWPDRSHRDPERTRGAILAAATREFAEKGFGGARVDSIALRAGTNKRMLYHYFGDKEALYLVVLEEAYAGIRGAEATLDLGHREPEEGLRELALFTWRYFVEHPEFISLLNTENLMRARFLKGSKRIREMQTHLVTELTSILERGERQGVFAPGLDPLHVYLTHRLALGLLPLEPIHALGDLRPRTRRARPARRLGGARRPRRPRQRPVLAEVTGC